MSFLFNLSRNWRCLEHLQLEFLPKEIFLQTKGGGSGGGGGDEEEEEQRHPHSDVVNWGYLSDNSQTARKYKSQCEEDTRHTITLISSLIHAQYCHRRDSTSYLFSVTLDI